MINGIGCKDEHQLLELKHLLPEYSIEQDRTRQFSRRADETRTSITCCTDCNTRTNNKQMQDVNLGDLILE